MGAVNPQREWDKFRDFVSGGALTKEKRADMRFNDLVRRQESLLANQPDLTDEALRLAGQSQRRRLMGGRGLKSTFVTGQGVSPPTTLLGG